MAILGVLALYIYIRMRRSHAVLGQLSALDGPDEALGLDIHSRLRGGRTNAALGRLCGVALTELVLARPPHSYSPIG